MVFFMQNIITQITRDVEQQNFITQNFKLKALCSSLFVKSQHPISAYIKCVLYCVYDVQNMF